MADSDDRVSRGRVDVFGSNAFRPPIVSSDDVTRVVVRDVSGTAVMFLQRLADDTWAFCSATDSDWSDAKARFGVR